MDVTWVTNNELCIGCGACYVVCPTDAIQLVLNKVYVPVINKKKCVNCKKCLKVCPSIYLINDQIKSSSTRNSYLSQVNSRKLETKGSSGGTLTVFQLYLLKNKIVDKIISGNLGKKYKPNIVVSGNNQDILANQGSCYYPIPVLAGLKKIYKHENYALVGLPCHLVGLYLLKKQLPELDKYNVLNFGLFCGRGVDANGTKYIVGKLMQNEPGFIKYRYGEWPGNLLVTYIKNKMHTHFKMNYLEFSNIVLSNYMFMPKMCLYCDDFFNQKSDISFGDAWGFTGDSKSIILGNTEKGDSLIKKIKKTAIIIEDTSYDKIKEKHFSSLFFKQISVINRRQILFSNSTNPQTTNFIVTLFNVFIIKISNFYSILLKYNLLNKVPILFLKLLSKTSSLLKYIYMKLYTKEPNKT